MAARILFIDAYDSFSNNIVDLLETNIDCVVTKIHIDDPLPIDQLHTYAGVVVGPGPGNPYVPADIGCVKDLWTLEDKDVLPVLGICLGFQSLVVAFGGKIEQLPYPRHGFTTEISTSGDSIFKDVKKFEVVQYHSLQGILGHGEVNEDNAWSASKTCPDLVPIGWDIDHTFSRQPPAEDDPRAERGVLNPRFILMGVRHATKPFSGVQFHPESVKSSEGAQKTVANWWEIADYWNKHSRQNYNDEAVHVHDNEEEEHNDLVRIVSEDKTVGLPPSTTTPSSDPIFSKTFDSGSVTIPFIRDTLSRKYGLGEEIIILDSEMNQLENLGVHSCVGLIFPDTLKLSYTIATGYVKLMRGEKSTTIDLRKYHGGIGKFIKALMAVKKVKGYFGTSPFVGGLMGYIDYEACLETLKIPAPPNETRPNISMAFIERSVMVNHATKEAYVQSIRPGDEKWVEEACSALLDRDVDEVRSELDSARQSSRATSQQNSGSTPNSSVGDVTSSSEQQPAKISHLTEKEYCDKVKECHVEIRKGNTYELCLTGTTEIRTSNALHPWLRYLQLRTVNPATFGAYIRLGPATVLSSSPERFMSWTRPDQEKGESICQYRPIKGTIKKRQTNPDGSTKFVDLETATKLLNVPKEQAENLMIADLIRHDLYGIAGSGNVWCKPMCVEEYYSVYQLVTVIEGVLKPNPNTGYSRTGMNVLGNSLPPGSMTGAPKKRSCELLRGIENNYPRSIYSGVLGYLDAAGGGDFSVVIRTAYRWDDDIGEDHEIWRIGAGGAVTDMSTPIGEYEEMRTKLEPVLRIFT